MSRFDLKRGEIVGLFGLVGAGRTEVARVIFGVDRAEPGTIELDGRPITIADPTDAVEHGIAYVPEDRHAQGLVMSFPIDENITLPILRRLSRFTLVETRRGRADRGRLLGAAPGQVGRAGSARLGALRRQPAKGRARQVAGDGPACADPRRADPGHRYRHKGRGSPDHLAPRHAGPGHPDDLQRAAGDPRHDRPRAGHARGADQRRVRPRTTPTRSESCLRQPVRSRWGFQDDQRHATGHDPRAHPRGRSGGRADGDHRRRYDQPAALHQCQ